MKNKKTTILSYIIAPSIILAVALAVMPAPSQGKDSGQAADQTKAPTTLPAKPSSGASSGASSAPSSDPLATTAESNDTKNGKSIRPILRVNNAIITNYDLLTRQRIYFLENNMTESPEVLQQTRDAVLKMLVYEKLESQFADQSGVPDYTDQAQQQLAQVAQQNKQTPDQMLAMLNKRGINPQDLLLYIATTIRWQSVIYGFINQYNVATPTDINDKVKGKKALVGKKIYQVLILDISRPDPDYLQKVTGFLQKNPSGWRRDLSSDIQSGRIVISQRADMTAKDFGEPFTNQLLQQKAAIPPGSIMGPKYATNGGRATLYILMGDGVMPAMEINQLRDNIAGEIKDRALQPLDDQMKARLWRDAVIQKM